jgi:hypothetical protein
MTWLQGHPADYDGWQEDGAEGWGWPEMLPVARRVEHHILGSGPFHGAGGPMTVDFPRDVNPSAMAFIAAGEQLGLPVSRDLNGSGRTGFGLAQANIRDGVRHGVVDGYLRRSQVVRRQLRTGPVLAAPQVRGAVSFHRPTPAASITSTAAHIPRMSNVVARAWPAPAPATASTMRACQAMNTQNQARRDSRRDGVTAR